MNATSIRYISRSEIDVQAWDNCINNARNGLIYAYSFYLDRMSKHWHALVLDDYKAVMPLTWNRKVGFYYLYQPAFTPSLGVFGNELDESLVGEFISSIPKKFRLIEISLNAGNDFQRINSDEENVIRRKNYVLPLKSAYHQLYNAYNDNIKRNIKKSVSLGCVVEKNIPVEKIIELATKQLSNLTNLKKQDYENFALVYQELAAKEQALTYGILLNGELISSAVYFFSHGRAYYILVGNHPNGKTIGASHYLIDRFIAQHANRPLLLDFEGSDIQSLALFYSSFGAKLENFPALRINRLPWYVSWLK